MEKKGVIWKVLNCFVIAVFLVSAVQFSVMAMAGDNSVNTAANGYSESKSSLTVNVHNLYVHNSTGAVMKKLRLPGKGKITVDLYKSGCSLEDLIAIRSQNFETNALYAPVTFTDLTPSEGKDGISLYCIKVFQEPDAKGGVTEAWGEKEDIFLNEGQNTIKFVRHTAWISGVAINGKSPYGDDIVIDINEDKKAHFKVTVKNDDYDYVYGPSGKFAVQFIVSKNTDKDTHAVNDDKLWRESKHIRKYKMDNFTFDFFPSEVGTYYFYLVVHSVWKPLFYPIYHAPIDQHLWQKGFIVVE